MIDYIYYKLYKSYSKKNLGDIPEFIAAAFLTCLIFINFLILNAFLAKIDFAPFLITNGRQGGYYVIGVLIIVLFIYRKSRREIIIKKYSQESEKKIMRGNIFVIIYISVTILLIFAVAFFKPGYLPSL